MSLKNDTLPNEFWKHLGKFDLTDYAQPRWSILVNDNGLQVKKSRDTSLEGDALIRVERGENAIIVSNW